jgi:hypothetical protein
LYEGENQHDATTVPQQSGNDPQYEYVKTLRSHEHEHDHDHDHEDELEKQNLMPERSHTRKDSKENKRGGLLGKILRRMSKIEPQVEPAVADDEASSPISPKRSPTNTRGPEDTIASVGTGAMDADELRRYASEGRKHSSKPSGEFAHLGRRNKLHKDPPRKYFQQHHTADSSGSDSPPALPSTVMPETHTDAEELMGDPYASPQLVNRHISRFREEDEYMDVGEPHMSLVMNGTDVGGMDRSTRVEDDYEQDWENLRGAILRM